MNKSPLLKDQQNQWSKDPNNWKLGMFYYNKEDDRLFPPKRVPIMGWTINFAKPQAIALFALLIVFIIWVANIQKQP